MMKQLIFMSALALASAITGEAMATCGTNQVVSLRAVLPGNTICQPVTPPVPPAPWTAQEMHIGTTGTSTSGNLIDYKLGSSTVDPTKTLGTYTISHGTPTGKCLPATTSGNTCELVTYKYTAWTPSYTATFLVYLVSGTVGAADSQYDFCVNASDTTAAATGKLKIGTGAGCP